MKLKSLKRAVLSNGLAVYVGTSPETASFELAMHIDTGSRDETVETSGVSHFLEHMMFRGSRRYPDSVLLAQTLEAFGGENNAMTTVESTVYWLRGAAARLADASLAFAEFFLHPNFADLETERNIILQELQNDYNEEGDCIDTESLGMEALFGDHPLGLPIIGREAVIRKLTQADLQAKRARHYVPARCAVSIISSLPEDAVLSMMERAFDFPWDHIDQKSNIPASQDRLLVPPALFASEGRKRRHALKLVNNSDSQYALKMMFPCSGGLTRAVVAETFLQRILDDGISSRLPAVIREKQGLVYDISADSNAFAETGAFSVDATVSKDSLDRLLARLFEELGKVTQDKPTAEEMERIRFRYAFDLETLPESHSRIVSREVWNGFLRTSLSVDEELDIVRSIGADEILSTAQRVFGAARRGIVLIGPRARKKRDDVEKFLERLAPLASQSGDAR